MSEDTHEHHLAQMGFSPYSVFGLSVFFFFFLSEMQIQIENKLQLYLHFLAPIFVEMHCISIVTYLSETSKGGSIYIHYV